MAFRKSIKQTGDENQANEQLSHNRIVVEGGSSAFLLVAFACFLVAASIIFMAVAHLVLLESLIVAGFISAFIMAWIIAGAFTYRQVSAAKTAVAVDATVRNRSLVEADVIHATENYILFRDPDGSYQFRGSTVVTENRQFLPHTIAPVSHQETILELYDTGMSGRNIEKHLKEKGVTYHQIQKTLSLFRPEWNKKTVESKQSDDDSFV